MIFNQMQLLQKIKYLFRYNKKIIALDALTGRPLWKLNLKDNAPRRGMIYYPEASGQKSRLYFSSYKNLMSVSANNGVPIKSFGKNGVVKLNNPSITSPAIYKENLIITTSEPSLEVYNLNTENFYEVHFNEKKMKTG